MRIGFVNVAIRITTHKARERQLRPRCHVVIIVWSATLATPGGGNHNDATEVITQVNGEYVVILGLLRCYRL